MLLKVNVLPLKPVVLQRSVRYKFHFFKERLACSFGVLHSVEHAVCAHVYDVYVVFDFLFGGAERTFAKVYVESHGVARERVF